MKWDVMSWTPDGYVAIVTMFNFQKYRHRRKSYGVWSEHKQPNKFLAERTPACCVSLSSFYNETIVGCPTCACGCQNNKTGSGAGLEHTALSLCCVSPPTKKGTVLPPLVQCTRHLCPIRVHWHVKQNYKSRVLASEDHNHKLQLPFKLLAVEHGSSTSEPRQHHSDLQLQLQVSHSLRWTK
ncbi:unnamed protein product [Brassica oleracea var. botrytis]